MESLNDNTLLGVGNPLLDISANVEKEFLAKYNLKQNDAILADPEKHNTLYFDMVENFKTEYIAGGSVQNALRVCQWLVEKPNVTTFFGCVGEDNFSKILHTKAVSDGVNPQYQYNDKEPTGTCAVLVTDHHRSLCANLGAANFFTIDHIRKPENKKLVDTAQYYYISGFFLTVNPPTILEIAKVALANDRPFMMNLSSAFIAQFYKEPMMQCMPYVDILFGNEQEAETFSQEQDFDTKDLKEIALKICNLPKQNEKRSRVVILTQGVHPVILAQNGKIKEYPIKVLSSDQLVDTNGAGDAFVVASTAGSESFAAHARPSEVVTSCNKSQVLLSTVIVRINVNNAIFKCRALLDNGSQSNFVTEGICKRLNLPLNNISHAVKGIGQTLANIKKQVNIEIRSNVNHSFKRKINCLVIDKITDNLPLFTFNKNTLKIPFSVELADPEFNISQEIDLLLGSEIFWSILRPDQKSLGKKLPILQDTLLGWIVAGNMIINTQANMSINCLSTLQDAWVDNEITRFWELEEVDNKKKIFSEAERLCEAFFELTKSKDKSGRYIIRIPFKKSVSNLGSARDIALQRFYLLEKKLSRNIDLKNDYVNFMSEYSALNHMSEVNDPKEAEQGGYYLPHHAVVKNTSLTTRVRIVFDASCKTNSGLSLNDVQFKGPTLQQDIFEILVRFRTHKYVMTGDINKMYRQILIHEEDRRYQKIFWRPEPDHELKCYKLNTVTYGTASAPYLAVKCLFDIAEENKDNSLISKIIKEDFYMDDLLTGADTEEELLYIQKNVSGILTKSGFELRKWLCNNKDILNKFEINNDLEIAILSIGQNEPNKTLGIFWDAQNDSLNYKINLEINITEEITKRSILSAASQVFDPLGILGPVIVIAKLLIQDIWKYKLDWDEKLPERVCGLWNEFRNNILSINQFKINRYCIISNYIKIELHGYSDASIKAYGACIYLRCQLQSGEYISELLCAKSRVAPLKQVSLPRLELCAAQLLANLADKVLNSLHIEFDKYYFWSDSNIALCWIRGEASAWKTFVANRVSDIQSLTNKNDWNYVPSGQNPADQLSRGVTPQVLMDNNLWWHGPDYLLRDNCYWNILECQVNEEILEQKTVSCVVSSAANKNLLYRLSSCCSLTEMLHVLSYAVRFLKYIKHKDECNNVHRPLLPEEIDWSLKFLIREAQKEIFLDEFNYLILGKPVPAKSKILSLNPILRNDLICVGGRLKNANLKDEVKYPIILPNNHFLTKYILENEHKRLLHCGAQALLCSIRERYWPVSGRSMCRSIVNKCLICFKARPKSTNYLMGNLPEVRVNTFGIFENVGTDYGGPFYIKNKKGRCATSSKCYICLFICMSTKAVHLELVSDLTSECFLAALNRFTFRRGKPKNIYSDNDLNYVGANREISKVYNFLSDNSEYIGTQLADENISWHFIPANSPTFGGIWEAGIKSTKFHIKRVIGNMSLTFEEFGTFLVQIEGILNSRPLCPLTEDPEDCSALTPAHFLIGRTITSIPEHSLTDVPQNRLSRWQHIQTMVQHYWQRWQKEYLGELQTRTKWRRRCEEVVKVGSLVLIKDDNAPVLQWQLGRVTELHRGNDDIVRVVTVRVRSGSVKRGINRVCVLPIDIEQ